MGRSIKVRESVLIDLVDFSPRDPDHTLVINSKMTIALVKSNDCDLISDSTNDRATSGCLQMLR